MASRLSEETLKGILDAGHQGLIVQNPAAAVELTPLTVDFDALLLAEEPEEAVQAVAPQVLFQSLLAHGPEDSLEILPLLSNDQVTRLLDYDAWREDRLDTRKTIRWLTLFREIGDSELARRFRDLEEEYQLAFLGPLIGLVDADEYEKLGDQAQDELYELPCHTLYYKIKSEDPVVVDFVNALIEDLLGLDVGYAYAVLNHADGVPPNEAEDALAQFRRARLTEDGFTTFAESQASFLPLVATELAKLEQTWAFALAPADYPQVELQATPRLDVPFLARVLAVSDVAWTQAAVGDLRQRLAFLANTLCAAAQVEPDNAHGIREVLRHSQALVGLGLEHLARGDLKVASGILREEHPQTLFRVGLTLVRRLVETTLKLAADYGLPEAVNAQRLLALDRRGALSMTLETHWLPLLGFEATETIKGLVNRFPVRPLRLEKDERGYGRMIYAPIASRAALRQLATAVDEITGLLYLSRLLRPAGLHGNQAASLGSVSTSLLLPLERQLMTALAQAASGGELTSAPLSAADLERLHAEVRANGTSVSADLGPVLSEEVRAGIEGSLRLALLEGGGGSSSGSVNGASPQAWSASRNAGIVPTDSVAAVMAALSDMAERLNSGLRVAAEGSSDEQAFAAQLRGLIETE